MVDKLCKNCKHWERHKDDVLTRLGGIKKNGYCNHEKFLYSDESTNEELEAGDTLNYWDYENYGAGFETGENFGCIHFEEGESK